MWHWVFWWNIHIIFLFCWLKKQSLTFKGVNTKSIWYLCFCDNRNVNLRQQKANWQHWRVTWGLQASPLTWKVAPINIHACIHYDYDITLMTERTFLNHILFENWMVLYLYKLKSQGIICAKIAENWRVGSELLKAVNFFHYSYPLGKWCDPSFKHFNSLYQWMLCIRFG